jgi:fructosamine-3-kinase
MDATLRRGLEGLLREEAGTPVSIVGSSPVGGGCIHSARLVELSDGRRVFVKSNPSAPAGMFEAEAAGLAALAAAEALRVPRHARAGEAGGTRFLVMEAIPTGSPGRGFFADFGRRFARLHRAAQAPRAGFDADNYLGATPQLNGWMDDWVEFWRAHRLGHQLELAWDNGLSDPELDRLGDRLLGRLGEWIDLPGEPFCLLHGDLWSGNFLVDEKGGPVLIDPAVYYGHREADLAMTRLFGGFSPEFYRAYEKEWPLPPGSAERLEIYKLYHLLNHLNLFGRGYRDGCLGILRRFG